MEHLKDLELVLGGGEVNETKAMRQTGTGSGFEPSPNSKTKGPCVFLKGVWHVACQTPCQMGAPGDRGKALQTREQHQQSKNLCWRGVVVHLGG